MEDGGQGEAASDPFHQVHEAGPEHLHHLHRVQGTPGLTRQATVPHWPKHRILGKPAPSSLPRISASLHRGARPLLPWPFSASSFTATLGHSMPCPGSLSPPAVPGVHSLPYFPKVSRTLNTPWWRFIMFPPTKTGARHHEVLAYSPVGGEPAGRWAGLGLEPPGTQLPCGCHPSVSGEAILLHTTAPSDKVVFTIYMMQ